MTSKLFRTGAYIAPFLLLAGCVDESYQLDDIDTTTRIKVDNLVVPINLEPIKLGDFFEPDGNIVVKENSKGETYYAFVQKPDVAPGESAFSSDPISIPTVEIPAPELAPSFATLQTTSPESKPGRKLKPRRANAPTRSEIDEFLMSQALVYPIKQLGDANGFHYHATGVDAALKMLQDVKVYPTGDASRTKPVSLRINLFINGLSDKVSKMVFEGVKIKVPPFLFNELGEVFDTGTTNCRFSYDDKNEIWTIEYLEWNSTGGVLTLAANMFDFFGRSPLSDVNGETQFNIGADFYVMEGGTLKLVPQYVSRSMEATQLPRTFDLNATYDLDPVSIASVTGKVDYKFDGMKVDPINISDNLPDFLDDDRNNLVISNPAIYLSLNNPVATYGKLEPQLELQLVAERDNDAADVKINTGTIKLPAGDSNTDKHNFVLVDKETYEKTHGEGIAEADGNFENAEVIPVENLRHLLSSPDYVVGDENAQGGLPKEIKINVVDPCIPESDANNFPLGKDLDAIDGNYEIVAPLSLGDNTLLIYEGTSDWDMDDMEGLHLTTLSIGADVESKLPVTADLSVELLKKDPTNPGELIPFTKEDGVTCEPVKIPAGEKAPMKIVIKIDENATISNIAGIRYIATLGVANENALSPDQTITLTNTKATIGGYYESNFDD